jgi:AcrR family transcriptional regulator
MLSSVGPGLYSLAECETKVEGKDQLASYVKRHVRKSQAERRAEILEAAMEVISEYGVVGATVSRIAARVGMTPGALYRHFESRASLISEANEFANQRSLNWVESLDEPDILQRLEKLGEAHVAWAKENFTSVVRPFFFQLASAPDTDPDERLVVTKFGSFEELLRIADEGRRQGVIRPDVRPEEVAWALHMVGWAQDLAIMSGAEEAIDDGTLGRIWTRLIESFAADPQVTATDER